MVSAQLHGAMEVDQLIEYGINSHVAVTCGHVTCNQYHTRYTFVDENVQCGRYLGSYRIRMRMTLFHPPKGMNGVPTISLSPLSGSAIHNNIPLPHADNEFHTHTQYLYNQMISMIIL